jgi:hypothetical protein
MVRMGSRCCVRCQSSRYDTERGASGSIEDARRGVEVLVRDREHQGGARGCGETGGQRETCCQPAHVSSSSYPVVERRGEVSTRPDLSHGMPVRRWPGLGVENAAGGGNCVRLEVCGQRCSGESRKTPLRGDKWMGKGWRWRGGGGMRLNGFSVTSAFIAARSVAHPSFSRQTCEQGFVRYTPGAAGYCP